MDNEQSSPLNAEQREEWERERRARNDETLASMEKTKEAAREKFLQELIAGGNKQPDLPAKSQSASSEAVESAQDLRDDQPTPESLSIRSGDFSQRRTSTTKTIDPLQAFHPRKHRFEQSNDRPGDRNDTVLPVFTTAEASTSAEDDAIGRASEDAQSKLKRTFNEEQQKQKRQKVNHEQRRESQSHVSGITRASGIADERKPSISAMPKIPKKSTAASPQSPTQFEGDQLGAGGEERPPRWYKNLEVKNKRGMNESNVDTLLQSLRTQISKGQAHSSEDSVRQEAHDQIRHKLHEIIFIEVTESLLKRNRMLHNEDGLPQLFDSAYSKGVDWPFDIKADAEELYNKWSRRVFETDILRGIRFTVQTAENKKDGLRTSDSVDPKYQRTSKYHGNGDLLNGQWWPTQLSALRDGAHGSSQGGISGQPGEGAYSVIMSGGHDYEDEDHGNWVKYCGTDSEDGSVTEFTRRMLESVGNHLVRLIRSHNLGSAWAPKLGFRYDGLYDVVSYENLDATNSVRQRHRFRLERQHGQDPIRGGNGPATRPTKQEEHKYEQHQRFAGKKKSKS